MTEATINHALLSHIEKQEDRTWLDALEELTKEVRINPMLELIPDVVTSTLP